MNTLILQFRKVTPLCLIVCALGCFVPLTQAVSPLPDGGYPNFTTAEGDNALVSLTTGAGNTAVGWFAVASDSTGSYNTAVGAGALNLNTADLNTAVGAAALLFNTSGTENTATGAGALEFNTSALAFNNTADGALALFSNTTGQNNTAVGDRALHNNTVGGRQTAVGSGALQNCVAPATDVEGNTAVGTQALFNDTTGNFNVAIGDSALVFNTIGAVNTAIGLDALNKNTEGNSNTATGGNALFNNTTGIQNTAAGLSALLNNTTGMQNTAVGIHSINANITGSNNTAVGNNALINSTGNLNTALGNGAGSAVATANDVICIGNVGADVSATAWIGNVFGVTTISGTTAPVIVSNTGQLGTVSSSERFKKDIATMEKASEVILSLRPVTFHYKTDKTSTPQFGLIAEEVAKVNPSLVIPDKEGKPYTVRYEAVNAMLLNEFLKEHRKVESLEKAVAEQQKENAAMRAMLKEQAAQIQNVAAQLELNKPAPQTVSND
jgi:hypothetical protein